MSCPGLNSVCVFPECIPPHYITSRCLMLIEHQSFSGSAHLPGPTWPDLFVRPPPPPHCTASLPDIFNLRGWQGARCHSCLAVWLSGHLGARAMCWHGVRERTWDVGKGCQQEDTMDWQWSRSLAKGHGAQWTSGASQPLATGPDSPN